MTATDFMAKTCLFHLLMDILSLLFIAISTTQVRSVDQSIQAPSMSVDQERLLDKAFGLQPYPNKKQRQHLAAEIHTTEDLIKLWFRERRVTLKNQLSHHRQRSAKLAYLNSLAHSLVMQPVQPTTPRQTRPAMPFVAYPPVAYSRAHVVPSMYSRSAARQSPYMLPSSPALKGCPRSYWYY